MNERRYELNDSDYEVGEMREFCIMGVHTI